MFRRWPLAAAVVTVLVAAALLADVTPYLRGGYGWRWPYHLLPAGWLLALAAAAAVYLAGATWLLRRTSRAAPLLVWSAAGAVVFTRPDGAPLFRLTGWAAAFETNHLRLHLRWEAETALLTPYWFTAALVGPDGRVIAGAPWQPGVEIGDTAALPLPPDAPPGDWWISLAVYGDPAAPDGRLGVAIPGQPPDIQIGLGPVRVPG